MEAIWKSTADTPEAREVTEDEKRLIDERLEVFRRTSGAGFPGLTLAVVLLVAASQLRRDG